MNRVIKVLGISKSTVFYKRKPYPQRSSSKRKEVPLATQNAILEIVQKKATYGVPRVRAILRRDYGICITHYLAHRFMKENNLLLNRGRTRGTNREHTGKISVDTPNTRWASDITSIKCWNGEKLRLAIILDCCDRSVIAWKVGKCMQASDIEFLVQESLFVRFGEQLPPKGQLQFLHDNGPEYIEKELNKSLASWNIESCSTPTYSPQSNGMCESFNGTFKRDYVYENCLDNPKVVIGMIPEWIEEYNSYAPHSALGMKTPIEFFNYKMAA